MLTLFYGAVVLDSERLLKSPVDNVTDDSVRGGGGGYTGALCPPTLSICGARVLFFVEIGL